MCNFCSDVFAARGSVVGVTPTNPKATMRVIYLSSGARGPPQLLKKKTFENAWTNDNFSCGFPSIPGIAPGVAPRIVVLHCTSRETRFRKWDFAFRDLFSEVRELLREYPGTLPELREWPFHSESVLLEIGVVREEANREKPTAKKLIDNEMFFFSSPFMSLTKP